MDLARPIIVLGPERSGTSAWTEMVHAWGAHAGERSHLPAPDARNPRGRWEYQPLWDLLAELGEFASGTSWWEESFPSMIASKAHDPQWTHRAQALVSEMESQQRPWVWKDPALCHFLDFWQEIWIDPLYLITVRHPIDTATSWQQYAAAEREPTSLRCNLLRWQHMSLSVLRATEPATRKLFVEFEQLTQSPLEQAARLAHFLDAHLGRQTTEATAAKMASVCEPGLWRNRNGHAGTSEDNMTEPQAALYRFLQSKTTHPSEPFADNFPMPSHWRATIMNEEAVATTRHAGR
jgi:hypothetical protein